MSQETMFQSSVRRVNQLVLGITAVLDIMLLAGYLTEWLRGGAPFYQVLAMATVVVVTLAASLIIYRRNPDSMFMRLLTATGGVALVGVALHMAKTPETYVISIIFVLPYILYFDTKFISWYGGIMLATNLAMTGMGFLTKPEYYAYSQSGLSIQIVSSVAFYISILLLTYLAVQLNNEKLESVSQAMEKQEGALISIMQIAGSIRSNIQRGEQIGDQLNTNVDQVSQVLQEITGTVLHRGEKVIEEMNSGTEKLRQGTETAVETMRSLEAACDKIAGMTQLISSIAMQTNLLSLNASVESARVGEAGRGFAVVADEVKQLAEKSMKSAEEIDAIIRALQSEAHEATTSMEQVNQITRQISSVSRDSNDVFTQIEERIRAVHTLVDEVVNRVHEVAAANRDLNVEVETMVADDTDGMPDVRIERREQPALHGTSFRALPARER